MPSGCLYSVSQQAVNIVFQQQSTSGGSAFKQQSQLFDTASSHLSAQPTRDLKVHLPIKHGNKNANTPSLYIFFSPSLRPLLTQLPMITQSAFDFTTQTRAAGMYTCAHRSEEERGERGKEKGRGTSGHWEGGRVVPQMWMSKKKKNQVQFKKKKNLNSAAWTESKADARIQTHKHGFPRAPPPPPPPAAVSLWLFSPCP